MSYQLELRHLRYFLAVAEELHFKKAADKLFISQPGLSKQIKVLEDLLDIQLFERHNRKVELTDTGKYLQSELSQWLLTLDNIMTHAESISKGYDGNLRFGYVGSAMHEVIPELLSDIRKTLPKIICLGVFLLILCMRILSLWYYLRNIVLPSATSRSCLR